MKVSELMSTQVHSCAEGDALQEPARIMWTYDVGVVPVVDGQGQVVGMVTDRDVAMSAFLRGQPLSKITVASAMSKVVYSCRDDDDVSVAQALMAERQIRRLPVIDDSGGLAGLISVNDISRAAARDTRDLSAGGVVKTLGAIGRPRGGGSAEAPPASRLRAGVGVFDAGDDAPNAPAEDADLDSAMDDLRQRRDELRLQMHLARAEARDEWEKAEEGWRSLQTRLVGDGAAVAADVQDLARKLLHDIAEGYRRIRHSMQTP